MHDRWWLTSGSGLKMGTSFNGLGRSRDSEIAYIEAESARQLEHDPVDKFLLRREREHNGEKLTYEQFSL